MSCPTCSKTMQLVFMDKMRTIHHCPTCGTLRSVLLGHTDDVVPALVGRCRDFERAAVQTNPVYDIVWYHLGIAESIRPEGERAP